MSANRPNRTRDRQLLVRMTDEEREVLDRAAELAGNPVSAFVRAAAIREARRVLRKEGE